MPQKAILLNKPHHAPNGHKKRQNGRYIRIIATKKKNKIANLNTVSQLARLRNSGCNANNGIPASNVPAGQIYLQNTGSPIPVRTRSPTGRMTTRSTAHTYFKRLSCRVSDDFCILATGTRNNKSCRKPNGQSQPQRNRPNNKPQSSSQAATRNGKRSTLPL